MYFPDCDLINANFEVNILSIVTLGDKSTLDRCECLSSSINFPKAF